MRHPFIRTLAGQKDPYFKNTTLLLHGDGTNGGQNNTFLDSSANAFAITRNGNTTQGTFSPYGDNWSVAVNGSSGYLTSSNNANLALGNSDFTFECWVNGNSFSSTPSIFFSRWGGNNNYGYFISYDTYGLAIYYSTNGTGSGNVARYYGGTLTPGTWHHVAICRASGTMRGFIDGTQVGSSTSDNVTFYNSTAAQIVGGLFDGPTFFYPYSGLISNVRVVIGTGLYTSNFSPSSTPLTAITNTKLLTCASNRFVDKSATSLTITTGGTPTVQRFSPFSPTAAYAAGTIGGSGYFDGSGDYLSTSISNNVIPTTGDFTAELWIYPTGQTLGEIFAFRTNSPSAYSALRLLRETDGASISLFVSTNGSSHAISAGFSSLPISTWTHLAVVRNGGTFEVFRNGASVYTSTAVSSGTALMTGSFNYVGALNTGSVGRFITAYLSDLRVTHSAVYTAAFTPPTAPLTAITNTSLLLNFTNAAILDNAMMTVPETVGNAQIDTTTKKFGTGSLEFDGTGDYLTVPNNVAFNFGTGDFTVEAWVYIAGNSALNNSSTRDAGIIASFPTSIQTLTNVWGLSISGSGTTTGTGISFSNWQSGSQSLLSATVTVSQTSWNHIAVARSGTTTKLFLNGTEVASGTLSNQTVNSGQNLAIGRLGYPGYIQELNGYIDDLRITKGFARYTANFIPPTAPFPDF